eukprot:gene22744-27458_t
MIINQETDSGERMSKEDVNKIKRSMFDTALNTTFFSSDASTDKVRVYLMEPREDGSTVAEMTLEDEEDYPAHARFMMSPLMYRRNKPFCVKQTNGALDYDAAWHAMWYFMQLKFGGPSSTKALEDLCIMDDEDPLSLSSRFLRLVARANRAHSVDRPLVNDESAMGHFLDALPVAWGGGHRQRKAAPRRHQLQRIHAQGNDRAVAQQIFEELKEFENKCLRRALDQDNLHKYAHSFPTGATKNALLNLVKPSSSTPAKPTKPIPGVKPLTAPKTSTTNSGYQAPRSSRDNTFPSTNAHLNEAGRNLLRNMSGNLILENFS